MTHGLMYVKYGRELKHNPHGKEFNAILKDIISKGNFKFINTSKPSQLMVPPEHFIKTVFTQKRQTGLIG